MDNDQVMPARSRRMLCALTLLMAVLPRDACAQALRPEELLKADVPPADHRLSYGPGALQFGELRLPKTTGPHAVAMIIHGGCWVDRLPGSPQHEFRTAAAARGGIDQRRHRHLECRVPAGGNAGRRLAGQLR